MHYVLKTHPRPKLTPPWFSCYLSRTNQCEELFAKLCNDIETGSKSHLLWLHGPTMWFTYSIYTSIHNAWMIAQCQFNILRQDALT